VEQLLDFIERFAPLLALAVVLAALVVAINVHGEKFDKHAALLAALDLRVKNLDRDRKAAWVKTLQVPRPLVPPPLPPRAPTLGAIDWEEELVDTEELQKKETGRYPLGEPPKGPNDE
jgi:hypothetical protein